MSSKRKAPVATGATGAAGKRRAVDDAEVDGGDELSGDALRDVIEDGLYDDETDDALHSVLDAGVLGDELGDELGDHFGSNREEDDDDFDDADEDGSVSELAPSECDEDVELPLPEVELQTATVIDLSGVDVSEAQARRIAPLLCGNRALKTIKCDGHDLSTADLREEDELEWDSEEFRDVEAIIIAEFLKGNKELTRLDLARNSISDAGACALALALRENSTLQYLNLESNVVAEKGGKALCMAVGENKSLSYLNVMYNAIPNSGQQELRELWTQAHQGSQLGLHL